ncbi:MAG: ATP-binding protein [Cryomorphaceae bacterium]
MKKAILKGLLALLIGTALIASANLAADLTKGDIEVLKNAEDFARMLDDRTKRAVKAMEYIRTEIRLNGPKRTLVNQGQYLENLQRKYGILLFVFRNDELIHWSHNAISPISALRTAASGKEIHKFDNGWYRLVYLTDGIEEYVAAIRIKNSFPYQNEYLDDHFAPGFDVEGLSEISTRSTKGGVKLRADHQFFYLIFEDPAQSKKHAPAVFLLFTILGGVFVFIGLVLLFSRALMPYLRSATFPLFAVTAVALRAVSIQSGWPAYIDALSWFSPSVYASSLWFPSLGDFMINVLILTALAASARYFFHSRPSGPRTGLAIFVLLTALGFAYAVFINHVMKGLVVNSNIPFDINVITRLNLFSLAGICSGGLLYFSFFLVADAAVLKIQRSGTDRQYALLAFAVLTLAHVIITHSFGIKDLAFVLWPVGVTGMLIYIRLFARKPNLKLSHSVVVVALFALVAAQNFLKYTQARERYQRSALVGKLSLNDDPVAELLFTEVRENLVRDRDIKRVFQEEDLHTRQLLEGYIIQRYFTGYWSNYNIDIYPFLADSSDWGKLTPVRSTSFQEFIDRAEKKGEVTGTDSTLFYLYESRDLTSYMAVLPLHYSLAPTADGYLVILMKAKPFGQQAGFPSLLVDAKTASSIEETGRYATAKYVNGNLRSSSGDYIYRNTSKAFTGAESYPVKFKKNGFEHLVTKTDEETIVVVSTPERTLFDSATVFSYLCAVFGILLLPVRLARKVWSGQGLLDLNLNQKIQTLLILLTLTAMVLFAWATKFYIEENYARKNRGLVREKMQSILRETSDQLSEEEALDFGMTDYVNRLFSQMSFIFYTDIHLFNSQGALVASSRMRMFNEGLISRKMHPEAYADLAFAGRTEYLHEERIGKLAYISAYTPLYNKQGNLLGYINLPYFARQAELEKEISSFLETVVNIFVLLFIISILIGLFISQWITAPLRVLRESLSAIELGKTNRILGYAGNDEIGLLVAEYNAKVSELEHNAERLAKSERESAWREMAKQVAHEIKNPLTPMKLTVQHLQRTLNQGDTVSAEQIERLTNNLVEQIDALTSIANAFSNFAKMPGTKAGPVFLKEVLQNTVTLFSHFDHIKITLDTEVVGQAKVTSDKDQLVRVFNNLIKNAVQSIPETKKGAVRVKLEKEGEGYKITVSDTGSGIDPELKDKIFVPNFTTKSRGMGLGLAMSKNIVEHSSGRIWYKSTPGEGSQFYVWLPAA